MLKKIAIAVVVLAVLFWGGLYLVVKIALPPEKVRALVTEHGSKALGRELIVEGASVGVFPMVKVSVRGVQIANAEGFSEDPLFKIKEVFLSLDFMSLIKFSPVIREIRLMEMDLLYEVNKRGKNNLEGLGGPKEEDTTGVEEKEPSEPPTSIPAELAIKSFVIQDARVRYLDQQTGQEIVLGNINQKVSLKVDKSLQNILTEGTLVIASISVSDKASGVRKGNVSVGVDHKIGVNLGKQEISIDKLALALQDIKIQAQGTVNEFMTPNPGLDLKLVSNEIKIASLLKEIPDNLSPDIPKLTAGGYAQLNASVAGILDTARLPRLRAELSLHEIALGHTELPAGLNNLNGLIILTDNSLEVEDFGFQMDKHPVEVALKITELMKVPVLEFLTVKSSVDLGPLTQLADKVVGLPEGFSVSGLVTTDIEAKGKLDPQNPMGISARGDIQLKKIQLKTAELPEKVSLDGSVALSNQKIEENLRVKVANSDLTVKAVVKDYLAMVLPEQAGKVVTSVDVSVSSANMDLDKILPTPSSEKPEPEEEAPPLEEYPELPKLVLNMDVNLKKTKLMDLEMTNFKQKVTLKNGVLNSSLRGDLYTGSFNQNLNVDLNDRKSAGVALKMNVKKVEANDFISRLNDKIPATNNMMQAFLETDNTVYGKFNMVMDVKTHGLPQDFADNLKGDIDIAITNGKLMNVGMVKSLSDGMQKVHPKLGIPEFSFTKLDGQLEAKDGRLIVKHVDIERTPVGGLFFTGSIGFDNTLDLNIEQVVPQNISKLLKGATSAAGSAVAGATGIKALAGVSAFPQDKNGNVQLFHLMGGTATKPQYKGLDKEKMATGVKNQAKDALKAAAQEKMDEAKAKLNAEKGKLQQKAMEEKAKLEAKAAEEKKKLEEKAAAEKKKAEEEAKKKAKEEGKKALKKFGF